MDATSAPRQDGHSTLSTLPRFTYGRTDDYFHPRPDQGNTPQRWLSKTRRFVVSQPHFSLAALSIPLCALALTAPATDWPPLATFALSLISMLVLAVNLRYLAAVLSASVPQLAASIFNLTTGAVIELIITIQAIRSNQTNLVQDYIVGSILNTILLTLGLCFIVAGLRAPVSHFNKRDASTISGMLMVAVASLVIPSMLLHPDTTKPGKSAQKFSHGTSIILLCLYCLYVWWRLRVHRRGIFVDSEQQPQTEPAHPPPETPALPPIPSLLASALFLLALTLALPCSQVLLHAVPGTCQHTGLNEPFIGLVVLPFIASSSDYTVLNLSYRDRVGPALDIIIGTAMQVALFLTPACALFAWATGRCFTLAFDQFAAIVMFAGVWVVNTLLANGRANYLKGSMCVGM
ncbi:hypothetical protein MBLNU230_g6915t1 [Neophaeotheca triangularis]